MYFQNFIIFELMRYFLDIDIKLFYFTANYILKKRYFTSIF